MKKHLIILAFSFLSLFILQRDLSAQSISTSTHSIFLCGGSVPVSCGANDHGQIGNGLLQSSTTAIQTIGLTGITSVAAGGLHSLFLKNDGTVWGCGEGGNGQLGDGNATNNSTTQTQVHTPPGIVAIAAGYVHSLFLRDDGTVWACGGNYYGCLGIGSSTQSNLPMQVRGLTGIVAVAAGYDYSLFLKNDGTVWGCGNNSFGQLATGYSSCDTVRQASWLLGVTAIAAGLHHSLFLKNDGTAWASGYGYDGELGNGPNSYTGYPEQVSLSGRITAIAAGNLHSLFLKNDGTVWACGLNDHGQLGDGTNSSQYTPVQLPGMSQILAIDGGLFNSVFLKSDGSVWGCGFNSSGQLGDGTTIDRHTPVQVPNLCHLSTLGFNYIIHGNVYNDFSNDCNRQINEMPMSLIPVNVTPGNYFTYANDSGIYSIGLRDSVNYTVTSFIPQQLSYMFSNSCAASYPVYLTTSSSHDTSGFDFGFAGTPCWLLRVDIISDMKRRCFNNHTWIHYKNDGFVVANNVTVHVKFSQYDIPVYASSPYTIDPIDSSLVFNIGTLSPSQFGVINIRDSIACINSVMGLTQCTRAWILPVNQCLIDSTIGSGWDHSSIHVTGNCLDDTIHFVIHNTGSDMTTASEYRIYSDNVLTQTTAFQLLGGDSITIDVAPAGATIRLEADQNPGHPGNSHPQYAIEGCGVDNFGAFSTGQINLVPQDDEDLDIEIDCGEIIGSHDPNEKTNSPVGVDSAHIVLPNTPIDFTIHFQNTGTDTAFYVLAIDSLSPDLDLSTLELGVSSHPYTASLGGQGIPVLRFTFDNINLVDSHTDELNSNGFVKYKITPKSTTPLGFRINNSADIYFDYNLPVRTNTAYVTLGNYMSLSVDFNNPTKAGDIIYYPNPTASSLTIETNTHNLLEKIVVYSMDGRKIKEDSYNRKSEKVQLELSTLAKGIYFIDCIGEMNSQRIKVVKL